MVIAKTEVCLLGKDFNVVGKYLLGPYEGKYRDISGFIDVVVAVLFLLTMCDDADISFRSVPSRPVREACPSRFTPYVVSTSARSGKPPLPPPIHIKHKAEEKKEKQQKWRPTA